MVLKISVVFLFCVILCQVGLAQYRFKVPKNTGYNSGYSHVDDQNQYVRICYSTYNKEATIEFYNLETGDLINQLTFKNIGLTESFYRESKRKIWLLDESNGILVQTEDGVTKKKTPVLEKLPVPKSGYYPYMGDMKWSPLYFYKNNFYLINSFDRTANIQISRSQDKEFIQSIDIQTNTVKNRTALPWLFYDRDYGMMNKFSSLRKDNLLIIAANFSNEIFIYNLENGNLVIPIQNKNQKNFFAATPLLTQRNFDISKLSEQAWYRKMQQHYNTNNEYINILYDPYKNQYYRTMVIKKSHAHPDIALKIIVLDDRFNIIKEQDLSSEYKPHGMFVTEKGLNILNHKKYKQNSDVLLFDTFNL